MIFLASAAFGDDLADRAKLIGSWQPSEEAAKDAGTWTFEDKTDEVLHVTYSQGDRKIAEFDCNTKGRDCEITDSGRHAKVSLWFNGGTLVELETKGNDVVKRRFAIADADSLNMEVIPIMPGGKTEVLHLRRVPQ